MGKRTSGSQKRRLIDSDESEDYMNDSSTSKIADNTIEDGEEDDIVPNDIDPIDIDPSKMLLLVKEFQQYVNNESKKSTSVKSMNHLAEEFLKASSSPELNTELFLKNFKKYLGNAIKLNNISVWNGLNCIDDFISRPEFITTYPDFPKKVPMLYMYYAKKNNLPIPFGASHAELNGKLAVDTEGRKCCEAEVKKLEEKYLENLEVFATNHPEINGGQKLFLNSKIKTFSKKLRNPTPNTKTPNATPRKPAKKKETAFDLYVGTVTEKYTELDAQERMEKLKKKFSKLPEAIRQTYEKIAQAR